jgi:hypothetical protein
MLNDPKNINERVNKGIYEAVLGPLKLKQRASKARLVKPGGTASFTFEVTGIAPQLFYLLLELNVFVDGCWNWFGVTWRSEGMRAWIDSELYQQTLPHIF